MDTETESFSHETTITVDEQQDEPMSAGSGDIEPPSGEELKQFTKYFDLEVGTVVVEDKTTGQEIVMWKARGDGKEAISPDIFDAVMQCINEIDGGVL